MTLRESRTRYDESPASTKARRRVAIYCRVSTSDQVDRGTIAGQRRDNQADAQRANEEVVGVFCDDGMSATSGRGKIEARKDWAKVKALAESGAIDAVRVVDQDRLTRADDLQESMEILGPLQRAHVLVVTPSDVIDLNTPDGRLKAFLGVWKASGEADAILRRTQSGKALLLSNGGKPHGMPPYGLRYDRKAGWAIEPSEHRIIIEIFRRVGAGESCTAIALDLGARDVPAPGRQWQQTSVWTIVRTARERYAGRWRANKVRGIWVDVPRLVSDDDIKRADAALAMSGQGRGNLCKRTVNHHLVDHNFARCSRCGGMVGVTGYSRSNGTRRRYYSCRSQRKAMGYKTACKLRRIPVDQIDAPLWDAMIATLAQSGLAEKAARDIRRQARDVGSEQAAAQRGLDQARKRVADAARKAETLTESIDTLPAELLGRALDKIGVERKAAAEALRLAEAAAAAAGTPDATPADIKAALALVRAEVANATQAKRRELVRLMLVDVEISDEEITADVGIPVAQTGAYPGLATCSSSGSRIRLGTIRVPLRASVAIGHGP